MSKTRNTTTKFKFTEGERVLCFEPDPTKARVLYDAKILETRVKKDGKGRKIVEYLIHFQGWNSSWDRYVPESFILQDTDDHRLLQKELADTARKILKENRKKKQRISAGLRGADPKLKLDSDSSSIEDGDSATRSSFEEDVPELDENAELAESSDGLTAEVIIIHVPDSVKNFLEEDYLQAKNKKVVKLPCKTNVVSILESFLRYFAHSLVQKHPTKSRVTSRANSSSSTSGLNTGESLTSATQLNLCKEFVDGIRVSFDFLLDLMLLYPEERSQFICLKENSRLNSELAHQSAELSNMLASVDQPLIHDAYRWRVLPPAAHNTEFLPSLFYGVTHICRLLTRLSDVIQKMQLTEEKRKMVVEFSEKLLQYFDKHNNLFADVEHIDAP